MTAAWQNSANILTLARLACIPLLLLMLADGEADAAFYVFAAAAVSDALDGFLAKRFTGVTALGAILDPLADKLLITALLAALALSGVIPAWLVALVLLRDVLIVAGTVYVRFAAPGFWVVPHPLGKLCTFAQLCLGGAALAGLSAFPALGSLVPALVHATAALTVASGLVYLATARRALATPPAGGASAG